MNIENMLNEKKMSQIVWVYLYEIFRIAKSIQVEISGYQELRGWNDGLRLIIYMESYYSKLQSQWWLKTFVNIPRTTKLQILKGLVLSYEDYMSIKLLLKIIYAWNT